VEETVERDDSKQQQPPDPVSRQRLTSPWDVGGGLKDCLSHCVNTSFDSDELFGCAMECFIIDRNLPRENWRANG
jgi:hypothetical protein